MAISNFKILLYSHSMFFFCILFPQTNSLTFNLTNLGNQDQKANIKTFGAAYISPRGLQVTSNERSANLQQQVGKATYIDRLHLWDNSTGKLADFSTHFVFVIDSEGRPNFADGLAFFLAPDGSKITAGSIDFIVDLRNYLPEWVTIGFSASTGSYFEKNTVKSWEFSSSLEIDETEIIEIQLKKKVKGSIDFIVDLRNYLPEWVTIGFSASTGSYFEKNTVKSWEFSSSLEIDET
ncbi:hypothetical protein C3L33_21089, partial [Rhododendron williamsianum]